MLIWTAFYLGQVPRRPTCEPLWVTLNKSHAPLNYMALRAVLRRVNAKFGSNVTLHDLRHTCAMRMAEDPTMTLLDIQTVMRHRTLGSTQKYLRPQLDEVLRRLRAHQQRAGAHAPALGSPRTPAAEPVHRAQPAALTSTRYDPDVLTELFGHNR